MAVNRKRLADLALWVAGEHAKASQGQPSEWDQGTWASRRSCGTVCCVAGKVALDDGCTPIWDDDYAVDVTTPDGRRVEIEYYAMNALGLTWSQASLLFLSDNELRDVVRIIGDILTADTP